MSVAPPLSRFDKKVRCVHPLVRAMRRAAELAEIERHVREQGVIRGPTLYAAVTRQGARDDVPIVAAPPAPIVTLNDCMAWLADRGLRGFRRVFRDVFEFNGRLFRKRELIERITALQTMAARAEVAGRAVIFELLARRAAQGRHCPSAMALYRYLERRHGIHVARRGGIESMIEALTRAGAISTRRVSRNRLRVTILSGPEAGRHTGPAEDPMPAPLVRQEAA